jgi:hypothetical protein
MISAGLTMALALVVGLPASLSGRFDATERTEVRRRNAGLPTEPAWDITTEPRLRMALSTRTTELTLGYSIRYALRAVTLSPTPELMQAGLASYAWHDRRVRVALTQELAFGRQTFLGLALPQGFSADRVPGTGPAAGGTPARADMVVQTTSLRYISERTGLATAARLDRRWTLLTSVSYGMDGGFDTTAQRTLPLQQGPMFGVHSEYRLSRPGLFLTGLDASRTVFSSGFRTATAFATGGIRHRFAPRTETEVTVGAGAIQAANDATAHSETVPFPTANASLAHELALSRSETLRLRATGTLAPGVNRLTATVGQRIHGGAAVRFASGPVAVQLEAGAVRSLRSGGPDELRIENVGATATYTVRRWAVVEIGATKFWQYQAPFGDLPPNRLIYLALTLQAPDQTF